MSTDPSLIPAQLILLLLAIGGVGGFLSGLLGVGGGIIFVPALFFSLSAMGFSSEYSMHIAVGSSLAVVLATGLTSAVNHYRRGSVDTVILRSWGPAIAGGVAAGTLVAAFASSAGLKEAFAVLTFVMSIYMALGSDRPAGSASRFLTEKVQRGVAGGIGLVSSMIGAGGAMMTVPFMNYIGVPMQRAIGTGAALGVAVALPGVLGYMLTGLFASGPLPPWSIGYVNVLTTAMIVPSSMLMAPVGVRTGHTMSKTVLRRVFAAVMMIVSIRMFMSL
jgi:uncharacterized membrane protein YfcA